MRVLFLDDMDIRHKAFARAAIGHELVQARTAPEAIACLKAQKFDYVSLDHDLAEEHYETMKAEGTKYGPGTGMDVVDFIVTMEPESRPSLVVVHSFNSRAEEMVARLKDAGIRSQWHRFNFT